MPAWSAGKAPLACAGSGPVPHGRGLLRGDWCGAGGKSKGKHQQVNRTFELSGSSSLNTCPEEWLELAGDRVWMSCSFPWTASRDAHAARCVAPAGCSPACCNLSHSFCCLCAINICLTLLLS